MRVTISTTALVAATALATFADNIAAVASSVISPKVVIISMFDQEADVWYPHTVGGPDFNVLACNTSIPGLSPLFPQLHCTARGDVCQITVGEGEANAAASLTALTFSPLVNLTQAYFLIAGVAGMNPKMGTIGGVTFAKFAVQVGLQFEVDAREMPASFTTGYFGQFANGPNELPGIFYGTEVFELNDALRQRAFAVAKTAKLVDNAESVALRAKYASVPAFAAGGVAPKVELCDTATSDTWWSGNRLSEAFENTTRIWTGGKGTYCTTQQEDNASLQVLLRGALAHRVDFARIIVMRSGSDFDRPPPGVDAVASLLGPMPGLDPSLRNLRIAGEKVVRMILDGWAGEFAGGVKPGNYIGDVFGTLGGQPDFMSSKK